MGAAVGYGGFVCEEEMAGYVGLYEAGYGMEQNKDSMAAGRAGMEYKMGLLPRHER